MRRSPWWELGGGRVWGTILHFTRDGSLVSPRVVAGGEEVAVVEAGVLEPAMVGALTKESFATSQVLPSEPVTARGVPTCELTSPDVWEVWDSS